MFADFLNTLTGWIPDWVSEPVFWGPLILVLVGLIGVLLFLRSRGSED